MVVCIRGWCYGVHARGEAAVNQPRYYLTWYALQSVLMSIVCVAGIVGQVS